MTYRVSLRLARRFLFAATLALIGLALNIFISQAQTFDATHLPGPQDLSMTWLVHAGDDPTYAQPGFEDSNWRQFNPSTSLKNVVKDSQPSVVWYRLHVKVDPGQRDLATCKSLPAISSLPSERISPRWIGARRLRASISTTSPSGKSPRCGSMRGSP
jgi:hypothetical protein